MGTTKTKKEAPSAKPAKGKTTPGATPAEPLAPAIEGSEQAHERFLPEALALAAADVKPFRGDASLAYHNAIEAVKAVMGRQAELAEALPGEDLARLKVLPDIVLGLMFAVLQADGVGEEPSTVREDLAEARKLRRKLLKNMDALTEDGVFTRKEYAAILAGQGVLDAVNDCTALAGKFRSKWGEIQKKTPVTSAEITRAAELGAKLQEHFKPGRARRSEAKRGAAAEAADRRDRLWTLAAQRADRLWSLGALLFGRAVDENVPALQATRLRTTVESRAAAAQKAAERAAAKAQKAADKVKLAAEKKAAKKKPS